MKKSHSMQYYQAIDMKTPKFSIGQIIFDFREAESRPKVVEICRKLGISGATFYNSHEGLETSELRRLRQLEL